MGQKTGRIGPLSAGSNVITTSLTGAPTWATLIVGGKNSGDTDNHGCIGTMDGTNQNVQYWSPASSGTDNANVIWIKDNAGTTQLKASWTSFGTSGSNGTVTINVSTNNTSFLPTLVVGN